MVCFAVPVVVSHDELFCTRDVNHVLLCWDQWLWIMVCYVEAEVVNHGVLCWSSGCESWCAIRSQWLWIMVCYAEPMIFNYGVLCWASGCESWWVMLCQWLSIMVCYAESAVVNYDLLCLCIMGSYTEPVNRGLVCCTSGCESWFAMLSQWLWIMVYCAKPAVVNHVVLSWASRCEL
jgi:hypothetical protein